MNTFKQKSLYAALAGVAALGATGAAQAVSVNADGLGEVLVYPYYTVRDKVAGASYTTLLSVVNTTASAKAVKVRVLEGRNSQEVLDFNLYLSREDVWVAAIVPTADGAAIYAPDNSCTSPPVGKTRETAIPFVNFAYTGANADGADPSLDRTREGYVEIIEMGEITSSALAATVTHNSSGVAKCDPAIIPVDNTGVAMHREPTGGLFGNLTIVNVLAGEDFSVGATALDFWSDTVRWTPPDSQTPTIADASPLNSTVVDRRYVYNSTWASGQDAVSAVLMHNSVSNEFVLEPTTKSGTDWVLTMPTKRFYVDIGSGNNSGVLFQRNFNGNLGSCDDVTVARFDREEQRPGAGTPGFSPRPPGAPGDALCWEANVLTFNNSNVFASAIAQNVNVGYTNGWARIGIAQVGPYHVLAAPTTVFDTALGTVAPAAVHTYTGLPIVGFAAITYNNSVIPNAGGLIQSSYGGGIEHKATRSVVLGAPVLP
jgi:hypothetical protein